MNQRVARDWSREAWVKQHIHEPLNELLWPLMQRAVRDYLRRRAEADGTLVINQDDPVGALIRVLGAHEPELGLAREAVFGLIRDGILESDGRSIWMPEKPESQARPAVVAEVVGSILDGSPATKRTSTERVRKHRERKRNEREALAGVTSSASGVSSSVPPPVAARVSPSRGDSYQDPLHSEKDQKRSQNTHHHLNEIRARVGVAANVSREVPAELDDAEEEDEEPSAIYRSSDFREVTYPTGAATERPASPVDASQLEITARAALVVDNPALAEKLRPDQWPEVRALPAAFARARNCPIQPLGRYAQDRTVELAVALYAAGYSQTDLVQVVTKIANQEWAKGKGLGSLLTFKVADANRPKPLVKTEANLSPRAAEALARAREALRTREAG